MAYNYTNYLEDDTDIENDFSFINRAGNASDLKSSNTAGEWCLGKGSTTSSGTGPTADPAGRSGFVYTETSSPSASTTWAMKRKVSFDASANNVMFQYIYNSNCASDMTMYFEYATVANPNDTTDWTIAKTHVGNSTDAWVQETVDLSAQTSSTLWVRFHADMASQYTHDFALSTFREYGTDKNTNIGPTTDINPANNEINESAPNDTEVGITASATDVDSGDTITYSLTDDAGGRFKINSTSGIVSVNNSNLIVYANNTSHDITIRSTSSDGSYSELTLTINVLIDTPVSITQVTDINPANNEVMENETNGSLVGITAFAEDVNYADTVTYSLTNDSNGRFTIHSTSGIVTVADASQIVYANNTSHDITIRATSTDTSYTEMSLTINVLEFALPGLSTTNKFNTIKTKGIITCKSGTSPNGLTIDGHLVLDDVINFKNVIINNGKLEFKTAGTYTVTDCNINELENTSSGEVIISSINSSFTTVGANITINNTKTFKFTVIPNIIGYEWRIYVVPVAGTLNDRTEVIGEESATVSSQIIPYNYTSDFIIALQIMADDYLESVTYYSLTGSNAEVTINLKIDENN